jgi:hypothetical protein
LLDHINFLSLLRPRILWRLLLDGWCQE